MTIEIFAINDAGDERYLGRVVTDSPNRAMDMYADDLQGDEYDLIWREAAK